MSYNANEITVLEGLAAVRRRPGMYIGDTQHAIMQMILEVLDNSIDEFIMGHGKTISIKIDNDLVIVRDYGRGIPIDIHHDKQKSGLELIMTVLHAGGKFDANSYKYSGGLHGVGVSVVNALSKHLLAKVFRNGNIYSMEFAYGDPISPLNIIGKSNEIGTEITFTPDYSIVSNQWPSLDELTEKFQQISYLNNNLEILLDYYGHKLRFFNDGGIKYYVNTLSKSKITDTICLKNEQVDLAFFWEETDKETIIGFTNSIKQTDGGSHVTGFKATINKVINNYFQKNSIKSKIPIENEDIRVGLCAIVTVKIQDPSFASQTKNKLISPEGKVLVEQGLLEFFDTYLEKNPEQAKIITQKVMLNAIKRDASQKARDVAKKEVIDIFNCFGKLANCQTDNPDEAEILLVEGDSAGGSVKIGRDRKYQAVFPLKGKPLNPERARYEKIIGCPEMSALIASLGTGIGKTFDIKKIKYKKIIIMTDADIDGAHIRALIIMFFVKMMPDIVRNGYLYVVRPPLFKITFGKTIQYIQDEIELESYLLSRFISNNNVYINSQDKPLELNELQNLIYKCNDIIKYIQKDTKITNRNIVMNCLVYDLFRNQDNILIDQLFNGKTTINIMENTNLKFNVLSIYGNQTFIIENIKKNDWEMKEFPVKINDKILYNPYEFMNEFIKICNKSILIQRYKGLGEMNPDELSTTSLDPNKRKLDKLIIPDGQEEEVFQRIKDIMGDEIARRSFILDNIALLFSLENVNGVSYGEF